MTITIVVDSEVRIKLRVTRSDAWRRGKLGASVSSGYQKVILKVGNILKLFIIKTVNNQTHPRMGDSEAPLSLDGLKVSAAGIEQLYRLVQ